eukprot:gene6752-3920_t
MRAVKEQDRMKETIAIDPLGPLGHPWWLPAPKPQPEGDDGGAAPAAGDPPTPPPAPPADA